MKVFRSALQSIGQNRLRSILAGFGIAWGIFLLLIFLGVGTGFRDGVMRMFNSFAQKSMFVYGGQTSEATAVLNERTSIMFERSIIEDIRARYGSVKACSPEMSSPAVDISYSGESTVAAVKGVNADYFRIKVLKVGDGRIINRLDDSRARNVAVIGEGMEQTLFGKEEGTGKMIQIGGCLYRVIGVLSCDDLFSMQERNSIYVPASSFISNFNTEGMLNSFCLTLSAEANTAEIESDLKGYLSYRYGFALDDEQAVYVANIEAQTESFESLFGGLEKLIWIVGICLLLSGVVGVCNVMLIIVKERTNEIGIRKAVGATSGSVISLILAESVTITFIAGIIGMALGLLAVMLADKVVLPLLDTEIMDKLQINLPAALASLVVLCLSGVLAGLFPAIKASQIMPVDAIRYENRG